LVPNNRQQHDFLSSAVHIEVKAGDESDGEKDACATILCGELS